jgi:hypothetical protein
MGGSGGGGLHSGRSASDLRAEVERSLRQSQLDAEVNALLNEQLAWINGRDTDLINQRLDEIADALGENLADLDRLLYGGSVSKHTYVDGLSDVDSLVVLKPGALDADTPESLRNAISRALHRHLDMGQVKTIEADFAVTVTYKDGNQVQLLPAVERRGGLAISDKTGGGWSFIRPRAFTERLTAVNAGQEGRVVPTIKLAKAVVESLTDRDRPGGYHMEALAVDAFDAYTGPRNNRAMVSHFFERAADRIKRPLADVTGQSERIDETWGPANSAARQRVSAALGRIATRMRSATSIEDWRTLFE